MHDDRSFKEEPRLTKITVILSLSLLMIGALSFIGAIYYFGIIGLFNILGVQYESLWSIFWFVLSYLLLGIPGDLFIKVLHTLMKLPNKWNATQLKIGLLLICFLVNWALISVLNLWFDSIEINGLTQVILACIIALIEVVFVTDQKKK
ncbi:YrvL family regulatory protein [Cytobacillus purgationiresistens]|uniref:Regulatory protein YrvL n=1 Tax=Cytobacillus purgationiresistens TaxID=863449 RepID=A0ABU0AH59_9BACI|nr:YrvL family regulatory protein [Cytobacillus purgationiresistens]MDQ0270601.1 hypothetical protein [Cytobacillus purgationiresistens]